MSKEVYFVSRCDYPGCKETAPDEGQDTAVVHFWFYVAGRGRKTKTLKLDMCAEHIEELRDLQQAMSKYDQKDDDE